MSSPQTTLSRVAQLASSIALGRHRLKADDPADKPADDDADDSDCDDEDDPKKQRKAKPGKKADDDDDAARRHVGPAAAAILRAGATARVPLGDGDQFIVNRAPQQTKGPVRDPVALAKQIVNAARKARGEIA